MPVKNKFALENVSFKTSLQEKEPVFLYMVVAV